MNELILLIRFLLTLTAAFFFGKAVSKLKLPAILGWLLAGIVLGPYALNLLPESLMEKEGYEILMNILECAVGLMIGTELIWSRLKTYGKALIVTTLTQSLGTFAVVSAVFAAVFSVTGVPVYLALIFGGIALATAPAPALSIVREFHTDGPVTRTLIPMAALDDIVGVTVFFTLISVIASHMSGGSSSLLLVPVMIFLPLIIGCVTGIPAGLLLRRAKTKGRRLVILITGILVTALIGILCNTYLMPSPVLNFMLMGMAFSAAFSNLIPQEQVWQASEDFSPILGIAMLAVIVNLGAPLDYHAIFGAGVYTVVYIVARAFGKYFGAAFGAKITHMEPAVQKYLGLTLLPHSGVSLVFTGIAVNMLSKADPASASIISGTIAAAAVINEIIAVIVAKKGFEWAGELNH